MHPIYDTAIQIGVTVLGLVIVGLAADRVRLRRDADRKQQFIDDCIRAARVPAGWCFGPSFLAANRGELVRARGEVLHLKLVIVMRDDECSRQRAKAESILNQAKYWARVARGQRVTIRSQVALLAAAKAGEIQPQAE